MASCNLLYTPPDQNVTLLSWVKYIKTLLSTTNSGNCSCTTPLNSAKHTIPVETIWAQLDAFDFTGTSIRVLSCEGLMRYALQSVTGERPPGHIPIRWLLSVSEPPFQSQIDSSSVKHKYSLWVLELDWCGGLLCRGRINTIIDTFTSLLLDYR